MATLFFDSSFGSGIYNQVSLFFISPWEVSDDLIFPRKNPAILRGSSVDYGLKSICGSEWKPFRETQAGNTISTIVNTNLRSSGYAPMFFRSLACLICGHWRGQRFNLPSLYFTIRRFFNACLISNVNHRWSFSSWHISPFFISLIHPKVSGRKGVCSPSDSKELVRSLCQFLNPRIESRSLVLLR